MGERTAEGGDLPPTALGWIDGACDRFEADWRAGRRPRAEDFLNDAPEPVRPALLRELLRLELAYRLRLAEVPAPGEYRARFPQYSRLIDSLFQGAVATAGEGISPAPAFLPDSPSAGLPTLTGYESVNPPRDMTQVDWRGLAAVCAHCGNAVELGPDSSGEITCPACGGGSLMDQERTHTYIVEHRRLGRFDLIEQVGCGSFGAVWRARDSDLGRIVAVKIPRSGRLTSEKEAQRFVREARSAAQLRHPGIVTVHEVGRFEGLPFLVAEFIQGVTLTEYLEAHRIDHSQAADLVAVLADALDYAHTMGVIHRDVKPSNIMLERCGSDTGLEPREGSGPGGPIGRPLLMDFGLALRADVEATMTQEGEVLGTPAYMSPEQAAGHSHRVDARSDVYSLGVVLYRLLTDRLPFQGSTRVILDQLLNEEPAPPRKQDPTIPRDLETICQKAMSKSPTNRYRSARELGEDLRRYLSGEPIAARPVPFWERAWRWARRRPAAATAAGLGLVTALALVGLAVALGYQSRLRAAFAEVERQRGIAVEQRRIADDQSRIAREQRRIAEKNLNLSRLVVAERELSGNNVARAVQLLAETPREERGWEWHYLDRQCHGELQTLRGHADQVWGVAYSPDGRLIASAGWDNTVRLWDAATGKSPRTWKTRGWGLSVRFTPDGTRLVATTGWYNQPHEVVIWDVAGGAEVATLLGHTGVIWGLDIVADGRLLASGDTDGLVKLWALPSGRLLRTLGPVSRGVSALAFDPRGQQVAAGVGMIDSFAPERTGRCMFWDVETGRETQNLEGHAGLIDGIAYRPDGRQMATSGYDSTVRLWDPNGPRPREERVLQGHSQPVTGLAYDPAGRRLASASDDGTARIWDAADGQELLVLRGHTGPVNRVAFRPDGDRVVTGGADNTIKVWGTTSTPGVLSLREEGYPVTSVAFSPDGRDVASAHHNGGIGLWDSHSGRRVHVVRTEGLPTWSVAFSPDGRRLASAAGDYAHPEVGGEVLIWDVATRRVIHKLEGLSGCAWSVAFSPDGRWLAGSSGELTSGPGEVRLWDTDTGRPVREVPVPRAAGVHSLAFAPAGSTLATTGDNGTVYLWDAATGARRRSLPGHQGIIEDVKFDASGRRLVTAGYDQTLRVWDLSGSAPPVILSGHANSVQCAAFSPDGQRIASASTDQTVKIWDVANGQEVITLRGHTNAVWSVAFSPDGKRLASAGFGGTIKIWNATPRDQSSLAGPTTPGAR